MYITVQKVFSRCRYVMQVTILYRFWFQLDAVWSCCSSEYSVVGGHDPNQCILFTIKTSRLDFELLHQASF